MAEKKLHFQRARYIVSRPLGEDGRLLTGSEKHYALARRAAAESMVLLKNNGILPLQKGKRIAVFGSGQISYEQGGSGAGIVFSEYSRSLYKGLSAKDEAGKIELFRPLSEFYKDYYEKELENVKKNFKFGRGSTFFGLFTDPERFNLCGNETCPDDELTAQAAAFTDTAFFCISRTSGEFYDRNLERDFHLRPEEKQLLKLVKKNFKHIVAVLNIGAPMEADWLKDDAIDAVLYMGTAGMEGGNAAADILCGDVCPSGKLTDTFAGQYADYPTCETFGESPYYVNYEEDIFVGYRYFETIPGAAEKVVYPFGFGLSYTTFSLTLKKAGEKDGKISVTVEVKNTGAVSGREIVQLYYGAPQGKLEKAAKSLAAFRKTGLLAPGESETLTLTIDPYYMASYDEDGVWQKSAYILEGGDYPIYYGTSIRDVDVCYTYYVDGDFRLVQQLSERCPCLALPRKLHADGTYEVLPMKGMPRPQEFPYPAALEVKAPETLQKFEAVAEGKITLDEFIAQMTTEELVNLLGGTPSTGVGATSGFGLNTRLGIPGFMTSDSPAGLRSRPSVDINPTAFPTAAILSCSWDEALVEEIGEAIGLEIKENNMFAWLGPALNIHRDPLAGRNFEYYSEDPFIAGKMAAAHVRGAQKHRISGSPKHFAANNKEFIRKESDSRVSERALREIYLRGFEICVKESDPKTIMTSYNLVNGRYASESADLQTHILRGEWGFDGLIMTDWSGHGRHGEEIRAGGDIKMPKGHSIQVEAYLGDGINGGIFLGDLHAAVRRILKVFLWYDGIDVE